MASAQNSNPYLSNLFGLGGRTALVTGGATGIGRMIAHGFAAAGATVFLVSRSAKNCEAAAAELNAMDLAGHVEGFAGDVGTEEGIGAIREALCGRTGSLSILVNNAGKARASRSLDDFPYKAWDSVFRVNVAGAFALTQQLLPLLRKHAALRSPSRVINIGSMVGMRPMSNRAYSYAASKAALHHVTMMLAQELAKEHITVNAIAPGPFETTMTSYAAGTQKDRQAMADQVPLGRWGADTDIAGIALYLSSLAGAYTTGAVIPVDGGVTVTAPDLMHPFDDGGAAAPMSGADRPT
jgi:NAD(P)-dependent dehydrogenase (short-subunit alcohol dehydrogenase family)